MTINKNDDLISAIENNGLKTFTINDMDEIMYEIPGENDEFSWWWIIRLINGKFALLEGGCDHTGWGCQSHLTEMGIFNSAELAAQATPEEEKYSHRNIRRNLLAQISGEFPRFTYIQEKYDAK